MATVTPFLWFDDDLEKAIELYGSLFGDVHARALQKDPAGKWFVAEFEILGQKVQGMNAGPGHPHSDAFSFYVRVQGQDEVDHYWNGLLADGGRESQCGWLVDPFGISWQIVPVELEQALGNADPEKATYAREAMFRMQKIVIADLTA